jgi:phage terminase small subunit
MTGRTKLNVRQQRFVDGIIAGKKATQAYRDAGYLSRGHAAEVGASELLRHPEVEAEVARRRQQVEKRVGINAAGVIERLERIADRCMQAVPVWARDAGYDQVDDEDGAVGEYAFDAAGANRSLELIGKHLRMWGSDAPAPTTNVFVLVAPGQAASPEKWAELVEAQATSPNLPEPQ